MKETLPLLEAQSQEIVAVIERVIFHNKENGFTVLKVQPEGKDGGGVALALENMVGHMESPRPGCRMRFRGRYIKNPRYGRQFAFELADEVMPATTEGIRHYLASGLIKGIGPKMAERIVMAFGMDTIRILDENPEELHKVPGIGEKIYAQIRGSWQEHRGMRDLLLFLQPHGISTAYALRIYRAYGEKALPIVKENPYRLAMDIQGIGFITADLIASKLGFPADHPLRIKAAAIYMLQKASEDGHVFLPGDILGQKVAQLVEVPEKRLNDALLELEGEQRIVREMWDEGEGSQAAYYLRRYHHCESRIAYYLQRLLNSPKSVVFKDRDKIMQVVLDGLPIQLAREQVEAVLAATQKKALVLTGGPGTGKTTIIRAIIKAYQAAKAAILLAAPTGRAAKRMAEATGMDARTIHRLLEYSPREDKFCRNEDNPLACGLLVIDEASMMDTLLFYHLLKAVPLGATIVLVGDSHQLPSVGPGNVLYDLIASRTIEVVELNKIFRQSAQSEIVLSAHLINRGKMPLIERNPSKMTDFYFFAREDAEEAAQYMVELIKSYIPSRFNLDPVHQIQLLTPMRKGPIGSESMNNRLQAALNPHALEIRRGERSFRLHDKVMQVRNNYDKDIFNGDMGQIVYLDPKGKTLSVDFDGVVMPYDFDELDELVPAYAISIHKSQGSEYPAVVIPVMMQHYIMLQRNLIYTGITRGKKLVVLVGETRALQIAISNNRTSRRYTHLAERLSGPELF